MKHQTDSQFCSWINHYGCFFMVLVYWFYYLLTQKDRDYDEIETIRVAAFESGIISGDLNHDGDLDDAGEGEIQGDMLVKGQHINGKDALAALADVPLHYVGRVPINSYVWQPGHYCIGEFYHEWTANGKVKKFTHYVAVSGRGIAARKTDAEIVTYDSIPGSNTVANGKLVAVRVFVKKG